MFVGLWVCGFVGLWVCGFVCLCACVLVCVFVSARVFVFAFVFAFVLTCFLLPAFKGNRFHQDIVSPILPRLHARHAPGLLRAGLELLLPRTVSAAGHPHLGVPVGALGPHQPLSTQLQGAEKLKFRRARLWHGCWEHLNHFCLLCFSG